MGKIYINQPIAVFLYWDAGDDPGNVKSCKIKFIKPDGTTGYWVANFSREYRSISYVGPLNSNYGMAGIWKFWPYLTLNDESNIIGEPIYEIIYPEGE